MESQNLLQQARLNYQPLIPILLEELTSLEKIALSSAVQISPAIAALFPHLSSLTAFSFIKGQDIKSYAPLKYGVVFSGGQAAGGHNVIVGLYEALKKFNAQSSLVGFLAGPSGLLDNHSIILTKEYLHNFKNMGGFDLLGSGRTKIETLEQLEAVKKTVETLQLDGLVIIGGDDSNTNAALLAEFFTQQQIKTCVIGVPKTIDGDLKNEFIETSFGFDTACKTYSAAIGNVLRDALSAGKYYFFIKLMGRSASHIALECAMQTQPNLTLIGEEIEATNQTLPDVIDTICKLILERALQHKNYGVILIPEGLIEFIPACKKLIAELNALFADPAKKLAQLLKIKDDQQKIASILAHLTADSAHCLTCFPLAIQLQLLLDRDPHGNVEVSKIDTEKLLMEKVKEQLEIKAQEGNYTGKFSAQALFYGYEGRACYPSNFDAHYCYALGQVAALLINHQLTGYLACVKNLSEPVNQWQLAGIPLISLMHLEYRKGKQKPVIQKALVNLKGAIFQLFQQKRQQWMKKDAYLYPGPIQFFGPALLTDSITKTLEIDNLSRQN